MKLEVEKGTEKEKNKMKELREDIKKEMLGYRKLADAPKGIQEYVVAGFMDQVLDDDLSKQDIEDEIFYYLKELGWTDWQF